MKTQNCKKFVLSFVLLFALFGQIEAQTETVAQIERYVETVSSLMKKTKQRIFADVASDGKKANWKQIKTERLRDAADGGDNLNENAYVWTKSGKIAAATFTFQSPSRDWAHFVTYYFRSDGTLAKAESALNTFYGNLTIERNYYFDSKGKFLKQNAKYLDLKTQKPVSPKELNRNGEFIDEKVKFFKNTSELPFIGLTNKKRN